MGQFTSKRDRMGSGNRPQVHFSFNEGGPPNNLDFSRRRDSDFPIPPPISVMNVEPSELERRGSRAELRRSSIYSTLDLVPQLEYYASTLPRQQRRSRPSLDALRKTFDEVEAGRANATTDSGSSLPDSGNVSQGHQGKAPVQFGWVIGVMLRCMLNMWGVILLLRLSWITSQAGILLTWLIILLSMMVTSVTALSISAIATNGRVTSGGTYVMISRSLGPEIGGPVGMIFSFANTLACALSTVGFAEVVSELMQEFGVTIVDPTNDVRIVGVITVTALLLISFAGIKWDSKTYILAFMFVYIVSFSNYFVGTFIPPSPEKQAQGIFGYRSEVFISNLKPDWRGPEGTFFQMFAIFFPSTIGILCGANICENLKDSSTAIPKGSLMAIFWTTISYLAISATAGSFVIRDASGNISDILPGNNTDVCVDLGCNLGWNFTACIESQSCKYGLANSLKVLGQASGFSYLGTAGIFVASLSSALGFFVSAPKIFQHLCRDNLYPYIGFFAKGYGKNDKPLRAYILCYFVAMAFILIAELNTIAVLISNFFLCSYCLINFSCFHASITNSPGWRPSFHYYTKWTALFGAVSSVVLMFLFTWWAALTTACVIFFLFGYVNYNKPKVNWGSSVQASIYNMALSYSVSLSDVEDHVKNFRPQCLVMTGPPNQRPALVDFVSSFTKNMSLMICGDIIMEQDRHTRLPDATEWLVKWLNRRRVRSFYTPFSADGLRVGARQLMQASGLGKLKPNTLVLGFKTNWRESSPESIEDYTNTIYDTFDSSHCLCVLRMMDGLDISDPFDFEVNHGFEPDSIVTDDKHQLPESVDNIPTQGDGDQVRTVFQNDQGKKTIDVYWVADDGGLTLLVPHLLTRRKRWRHSKVRVFILGDEHNMEEGRNKMIALLKRFRLDFDDVIVLTDSERNPHAKNLSRFMDNVAPFRLHDEQQEDVSIDELRQREPWKMSDKEFEAFQLRSERKVRLNEIIRRNSQHAALVLVSLPVPQCGCPSALYMAWLDTLTCGLHCPAVLIRGNQQNVLTFYCQRLQSSVHLLRVSVLVEEDHQRAAEEGKLIDRKLIEVSSNRATMPSLFLLILLMGGFSLFTCDLYEYKFINENKNWTEAQKYCRVHHTDLATVYNMTDFKRLQDSAGNEYQHSWIGLSRKENRMWHWSLPGVEYNETQLQLNVEHVEHCVTIDKDNNKHTKHCSGCKFPFFCYNGELSLKPLTL
ncbi:solute carrier family 12 member 3-like [Solea senegalensis]|uniref:Solute carrier family 12 member 3-like n=1 Tax=Solea senegalensis TaxID=28829 RepID=A0AAV6QXW2_SOLSE|nr:solute carrier family 12 member 3-like [Solea senegalensis]